MSMRRVYIDGKITQEIIYKYHFCTSPLPWDIRYINVYRYCLAIAIV
jgi:hypothetical protein